MIIEDEGQRVGLIWLRADVDMPKKRGFILDLLVDEQFRGRGYGKEALRLVDEKARQLGLRQIGLHVFAENKVALGLYEKAGYQVSSINMIKEL
jgi:ribosomal protein S18 acetylase RimI-like enzyme